MSDEIETIDKNPKSWAAWKREAERLQAIIDDMVLAAMDSESECLPLDYLQGHKDGLEWGAQLAEANHPETGDWLYDDPIELAKAIRKGPDMPPAQPAPVVPELMVDWQENEFSAGWNACRAAMLQELKKSAGTEAICRSNENVQVLHANPPAIPDGYVMVPKGPTREILDEFDSIIDYGAEDSVDAWRRLLASAPQEVK